MKAIDYKRRVVMPVYDRKQGDKKVFDISIYGLTKKEVCATDGHVPFLIALERIGLDPAQYHIHLDDVAVCDSHNYEPPEKRV